MRKKGRKKTKQTYIIWGLKRAPFDLAIVWVDALTMVTMIDMVAVPGGYVCVDGVIVDVLMCWQWKWKLEWTH